MFSLPVRICIVATAVTYGVYKLSAGDQSAFLVLIAAEVAKDLPTAEEQMRLAVNGTLDLRLSFDTGHTVEVIPDSSGFEAWSIFTPAQQYVAVGGELVVYTNQTQ